MSEKEKRQGINHQFNPLHCSYVVPAHALYHAVSSDKNSICQDQSCFLCGITGTLDVELQKKLTATANLCQSKSLEHAKYTTHKAQYET